MTDQRPITPALRRIDIDGRARHAMADQPAPVLMWVPIDQMVIDDRYQRPLTAQSWAVIARIAANFRWSRFGPVLVAPTAGGMFSIIDGQHRVHAAALCGLDQVPAMVIHIDTAEQARAFADANSTQIRATRQQIFRAALTAGDPVAIAADDACRAAGCQLMTYQASGRNRRPRQVFCTQIVLDLVRKHGPRAVNVTLQGLADYDTQGRVGLWSDYILRPLLTAVAAYPGLTADQVTRTLKARDPYHVLDAAARIAKTEGTPASTAGRAAFALMLRKTIEGDRG